MINHYNYKVKTKYKQIEKKDRILLENFPFMKYELTRYLPWIDFEDKFSVTQEIPDFIYKIYKFLGIETPKPYNCLGFNYEIVLSVRISEKPFEKLKLKYKKNIWNELPIFDEHQHIEIEEIK